MKYGLPSWDGLNKPSFSQRAYISCSRVMSNCLVRRLLPTWSFDYPRRLILKRIFKFDIYTNMKWKSIRNFSRYEISEFGEVRNTLTGKILKPGYDKDGYRRHMLKNDLGRSKEIRVHQAVADTFIAIRQSGQIIAHRDGIKLNNHFSNLRFSTHAENMADKILHGTSRKGKDCMGNAKLNAVDVEIIHQLIASGSPLKVIAARFGVGRTTISMIKSGRNWPKLHPSTDRLDAFIPAKVSCFRAAAVPQCRHR